MPRRADTQILRSGILSSESLVQCRVSGVRVRLRIAGLTPRFPDEKQKRPPVHPWTGTWARSGYNRVQPNV